VLFRSRDCKVFEREPDVFTNTFTNEPPPYTHRTTERYTIERIKHEATGKGKPCNASGGFVVKGNVLKSPTPPEFARFLPNTQSAPFTILGTESYLLKKHKFMTRPGKSECGLKSDKKTIGTSEYVRSKENDPKGDDCTKRIRIENTYPLGKMRVIHTDDGWYKRSPCSGSGEISWSNTSPTISCPPCEKKPTKYRLDSGAELNEAQYHAKKMSTIGGFNVIEINRDKIPADGTKCLLSTESGQRMEILGDRLIPKCNRWMVKGPYGPMTLDADVDVTSFSAVVTYVTQLPIPCKEIPTEERYYSIHCAQGYSYTNCKLADKNNPVYGSNCQLEEHDGTGILLTPPQCPTLGDMCNFDTLTCMPGHCVDGMCVQCGSPVNCEQYDKDVCGTDYRCYYECDPTLDEGDEGCPIGNVCVDDGRCRECGDAGDCTDESKPVCFNGACVECDDPIDCVTSTSITCYYNNRESGAQCDCINNTCSVVPLD
jgi:hypothetical protein